MKAKDLTIPAMWLSAGIATGFNPSVGAAAFFFAFVSTLLMF